MAIAMAYDPLSGGGSHAHEIATWGVPTGLGLFAVIAQVASDVPLDWLNLTALAALIVIALFLVTRIIPAHQKALLDSQAESNKTITIIQEKHTDTTQKIQQEYTIAMQGIVKDHKELMTETIKTLVNEKREQRQELLAHFASQVQQYINATGGTMKIQKPEVKP